MTYCFKFAFEDKLLNLHNVITCLLFGEGARFSVQFSPIVWSSVGIGGKNSILLKDIMMYSI